MYRTKNKLSSFALLLQITGLSIVLSMQTSCKKEEPCYAPTIDSIQQGSSYVINTLNLVPTKEVVIYGENLDAVTQLYMNSSLISSSLYGIIDNYAIIFSNLPYILSNDSTSTEEYPDVIRVIKNCGQTEIACHFLPPPPRIYETSNQYGISGNRLLLTGKYFANLQKVIFPGSNEGEIDPSYTDTTVSVIVPEGQLQTGPIVIISASDTSLSATSALFHPKTGLICNFDSLDTWLGYGGQVVLAEDHSTVPDANGYVFLVEATAIQPGDAPESMIMPLEVVSDFDYPGGLTPNYFSIDMEIFLTSPWEKGVLNIELGLIDDNDDTTYAYTNSYAVWQDTELADSIATKQWETIHIPLTHFKLKGTNTQLQSFGQIRYMNYISFGFKNTDDEEISSFGIGMDNIRLIQRY